MLVMLTGMPENGESVRMGIMLLDCETQFVACFNLIEPIVGWCSHFNFTPHSKCSRNTPNGHVETFAHVFEPSIELSYVFKELICSASVWIHSYEKRGIHCDENLTKLALRLALICVKTPLLLLLRVNNLNKLSCFTTF